MMPRSLLTAAALGLALNVNAQPQLKPLNVIIFPGGFNLPTWAAERQGYFEQHGVRVILTPTPSSTFQMQGLAEGRFDIAMTAIDNVVAYQEGQGEAKIPPNPDMFAFMGSDNGFLSVLGGKDIKSFADLKGKKLSVDALTTGFAFVLRELLAKNNISESEVSFERAGGVLQRFNELLKGTHAATVVLTPSGRRGATRSWRAPMSISAPISASSARRGARGRRTTSRRWSASSVPITRGSTSSTTRRTATWRRRCWSPTCAP